MSYCFRHLATEIKAFSLFATHFQELTALPDEIPSCANFHVTATTGDEGLTLLYQVCPGPSDRSFGLEVAKMARFQDHVIEVCSNRIFLISFKIVFIVSFFLLYTESTEETNRTGTATRNGNDRSFSFTWRNRRRRKVDGRFFKADIRKKSSRNSSRKERNLREKQPLHHCHFIMNF